MRKHAVKKLTHLLRYVPDQYKSQQICDKAVDTYLSTIKFVTECLMTQEMCDKTVNRCFLYFILFLIEIKIKKCVAVSKGPFYSILS